MVDFDNSVEIINEAIMDAVIGAALQWIPCSKGRSKKKEWYIGMRIVAVKAMEKAKRVVMKS